MPCRSWGEKQNTIDPDVYLLVIKRLKKEREPLRLLTNLGWKEFSDQQIVTMYLKRWGIENIFRSAKVCFGLEKIRVQSFKKHYGTSAYGCSWGDATAGVNAEGNGASPGELDPMGIKGYERFQDSRL